MRARVLHVVVAGEIGGAERMLVDLASRPERTHADHAIAVLSPVAALADLFRRAGLRVFARRVREGPLPFLRQALGGDDVGWLAERLQEHETQIVHRPPFASQVLGTRAARARGVPVVRTEHSTRAFEDVTCWPFARWSLRRAAASVSVSLHVRNVAADRAPWSSARMRVVRNGIDAERFAPPKAPPPAPLTLAAVGRLEPRKGIDLAIDAVARVPGVRLNVVGDGPSRAALERHARRVGVGDRVRFLGFVDDVRGPLAGCHAVLCTSRSEGLGVALLEAMSMERPVLGFRVGGVAEIVEGELDVHLAPPGDLEGVAASVKSAAGAPERLRSSGALARRRVVERFSVDAMCEGYARTYSDVVAGVTLLRP